jgi:outer membrane protein OmpA-like peptidoglycan-associated protein
MLSLLLLFHTSPGHTEEMEIHGSNTIGARLAPMLVEGFLTHRGYNPVQTIDNSKDNEKVLTGSQTGSSIRVLIAAHGSSTGFNALEARRADIWASSRAVKPAEVQQMAGRANLDNKAQRDLRRLAEYLSRESRSADELMLIGFADQQGNELRAQMISELRALSVRKALADFNVPDVDYTGYGHFMPVGMAGGASGQKRNGRVEVWVRDR